MGIDIYVGGHPDDIELGCGGSALKRRHEGHKLFGVVITRGSKGNHPSDLSECKNAAKIMGLEELIILDFEDTNIPNNGEVVSALKNIFLKYGPDRVYCHTPNDYHQDHLHASLASQNAARIVGVPEVLLFEGPSTKVNFEPHYFEDITDFCQDKIDLLKVYSSQVNRPNSVINLGWIESKALVRGFDMKPRKRENKQIYAEAFEINHIVKY